MPAHALSDGNAALPRMLMSQARVARLLFGCRSIKIGEESAAICRGTPNFSEPDRRQIATSAGQSRENGRGSDIATFNVIHGRPPPFLHSKDLPLIMSISMPKAFKKKHRSLFPIPNASPTARFRYEGHANPAFVVRSCSLGLCCSWSNQDGHVWCRLQSVGCKTRRRTNEFGLGRR